MNNNPISNTEIGNSRLYVMRREILVGEKDREYKVELILEWSTETYGVSCYGPATVITLEYEPVK